MVCECLANTSAEQPEQEQAQDKGDSHFNLKKDRSEYLVNTDFTVLFILCTFPELCGLDAVCKFHTIFNSLVSFWVVSSTNAGPLPQPMIKGSPYLGIISLSNTVQASVAVSLLEKIAFGKPV